MNELKRESVLSTQLGALGMFVLWPCCGSHMSEVWCRVCRRCDKPLIKAALLAQLTAGRAASRNNWITHTHTLRQPQAWQIRVRVNSCDIMQTHGRCIEKHSLFTKSFFLPPPNGEDKLSKLAPQILTGRNWWSPARCQGRGAPKHTLVRFRGFALIYFCYLFV